MADIGPLVGGVFGLGASVAPDVISLIKDAYAHRYDMELKMLELEAADKNYQFQLQQQDTSASLAELQALLAQDATLKGNWFVEILRASVRPVVTYLFLGMFLLVKTTTLFYMVGFDHTPVVAAIPLLWDSETMSLFAAVLSFWFGSRALQAYRSTIPTTSTSSAPLTTRTKKARRRTR